MELCLKHYCTQTYTRHCQHTIRTVLTIKAQLFIHLYINTLLHRAINFNFVDCMQSTQLQFLVLRQLHSQPISTLNSPNVLPTHAVQMDVNWKLSNEEDLLGSCWTQGHIWCGSVLLLKSGLFGFYLPCLLSSIR